MGPFYPGDRVVTVGKTPNCYIAGRLATIRGRERQRFGSPYRLYIVVFDDGQDNYDIDGSPGYIMREHEMVHVDKEGQYDID